MNPDEDLVELIRMQVAFGVDPFDAVVDNGVRYASDADGAEADPADVVSLVWRVADDQFAAHLGAQASWPAVTDSDRLTLAFRDLDMAGIVARELFACCQNCGHAEIRDEWKAGEKPRGYTFYHQQDAEAGVDGHGVYLAYGGGDEAAVAAEVVEALRARGLDPAWNGSTGQRIRVPLRWQRRRLGQLAAHPGAKTVEDFRVRVEPLDGWRGLGAVHLSDSARAWAALRLPWLPEARRVRITAENGSSLVVQRDWDRLVGTPTDPGGGDGRPVVVDRLEAWSLVCLLAGQVPPVRAAENRPMLEVSVEHRGGRPMYLDESLNVLRAMPVHTGGWATYATASGTVVQHRWDKGPRLWMEYLDPPARAAHGRYVTVAEAERVITALAVQDRVMLGELGPLTTEPW